MFLFLELGTMQPASGEPENTQELVPLNVIRVETALSRYPVHRLAKTGTASIEIREKSPDGEMLIQWQVSHNSRFGQPGPLAYKIDTLIVNRRIEEASRPIPRSSSSGARRPSPRSSGSRPTTPYRPSRRALYQNASAFITAKFRYKLANGKTKDFEAGFTRYSVVFTGEELPDGRRADAVYLVLNDRLHAGLERGPDEAPRLRLPEGPAPASQRLYELLSFQMFGAIKQQPQGRQAQLLRVLHLCPAHPMPQVGPGPAADGEDSPAPPEIRLHPERQVRATTDRDGKPDWVMVYVPGSKARAEFAGFTKRGGPRVSKSSPPPRPPTEAGGDRPAGARAHRAGGHAGDCRRAREGRTFRGSESCTRWNGRRRGRAEILPVSSSRPFATAMGPCPAS